jgi:hypothetical protein
MGRHGYSDDCDDQWANIRWRGQVASAIRGKRGQAFLKELVQALEAMPEKKLIPHELIEDGQVCTLGAVGLARGADLKDVDPYDHKLLGDMFNVAHQLIQEIEWENDENGGPTPEARWQHMHAWATRQVARAVEGG